MSHGPGRVQRAILDLIATERAMASSDRRHGPVGVPLDAVLLALYDTVEPTRSQYSSVDRTVRVLAARGVISSYGHGADRIIGRPRMPEEQEAADRRRAALMESVREHPIHRRR